MISCRFPDSGHILLVLFRHRCIKRSRSSQNNAWHSGYLVHNIPKGFLTWTGGLFDQVVPMTFYGNVVQQFSEHDECMHAFHFWINESIVVLTQFRTKLTSCLATKLQITGTALLLMLVLAVTDDRNIAPSERDDTTSCWLHCNVYRIVLWLQLWLCYQSGQRSGATSFHSYGWLWWRSFQVQHFQYSKHKQQIYFRPEWLLGNFRLGKIMDLFVMVKRTAEITLIIIIFSFVSLQFSGTTTGFGFPY